ncbi:MAG: hypothetical protein Ta2G_01150 [Termitinemataceae bacterium]|nr:MAG: hypothetical protein Ta2G_01150 [Termitinemataceae bacterium]
MSISSVSLHAQVNFPPSVLPFSFNSSRMDALGGIHAGVADDFYTTLFSNPAGLADVERQFSASTLAISLNNIDIAFLFIGEGVEGLMNRIYTVIENSFTQFVNIGGPIAIGKVGNHWGIGFFNTSRISLKWSPENVFMAVPAITEEFLLKGGYGFNLVKTPHHRLDVGILGKVFLRGGFDGPDVFLNEIKHVVDNMTEWPVETQIGFGFDAGIRWTIADHLIIAASFNDFFSPVHVTLYRNKDYFLRLEEMDSKWVPVEPVGSVGFTWKIVGPFMHRYFNEINLSGDFQGLLGNMRPVMRKAILDLSVGLEIRMLEVLTLRGSLSEMLPGGGIGLDFHFMKLDLAVFGRQLGLDVGKINTYGTSIQFLFRY